MTPVTRAAAAAATVLLAATALAACASTPETAPSGSGAPSAAAEGCGTFPLSLDHAFGTAEIPAQPEKVVVVTDVDLDIALALGVEPVLYPGYELGAWQAEAVAGLDLKTYDPYDGIDFEAIAAAEPDLILATSGWSLDEDYGKLSAIAPVVAYTSEDGLDRMTWAERTELAGCALGLVDEADAVIDEVNGAFAQAAADNPQFAGKTITYAGIRVHGRQQRAQQGEHRQARSRRPRRRLPVRRRGTALSRRTGGRPAVPEPDGRQGRRLRRDRRRRGLPHRLPVAPRPAVGARPGAAAADRRDVLTAL
jgi:hypothetical protein